jgi:hypothetical protein
MITKIEIVLVIVIIITIGFVLTSVHYSECSIPDIPTNPPHCPGICECNNSLPGCQIHECDHCIVQWYWICLI